jgi:hypothetical protein
MATAGIVYDHNDAFEQHANFNWDAEREVEEDLMLCDGCEEGVHELTKCEMCEQDLCTENGCYRQHLRDNEYCHAASVC